MLINETASSELTRIAGAGPSLNPQSIEVVIVILSVLLAATAMVTLSKAGWMHRRDQRQEALEESIRRELVERLGCTEPDWETWVKSMSTTERSLLVEMVERYLKFIEGSDRDDLLALADELDLEREARAALESASLYNRLHGLRRLALLDQTIEITQLLDHLSATRVERELAASVVSIETPSNRQTVVNLLLSDGPLSVFGLDVLYRVVKSNPEPLFQWIADTTAVLEWRAETISGKADLLAQVLLVLRQVRVKPDEARLSGVVTCLDHTNDTVRARACLVLAAYGWRTHVRSQIDVESLLADPSPTVRVAVYRMLNEWGDPQSQSHLLEAFDSESDARAKSILARTRGGAVTAGQFAQEESTRDAIDAWAAVDAVTGQQTDSLL